MGSDGSKSLKHQTIVGVIWNFTEQFLRKGASLLVTLGLAWLLVPQDFGLIAVVTIFVTVSYVLINGGLIPAVIRKQDLTELDLNTVFYTNILIALLLYGLLFIAAPFIAEFYEQERLVEMIRLVGTAFIFQAMSVVPQALIRRKMQFKLQLKVSLPASILSGVIAVILAYWGWGVWALVWQILLASVFTFLFYWRLKLWRSQWSYSLDSLKELFNFGGFLLLENLSKALFNRMYVIVIAKVFSLSTLGLYYFADRLKEVAVLQIVNAVQQVTFPALSKLQDDNEKLKANYRKVVSMTTFILFPILISLSIFSELLFDVLLPQKWIEAAPMLQLMAVAALVLPLQSLAYNIWMVKGQSKFLFYIGLYEKAVLLSIFIVALEYGIKGVLVGQIIGAVLAYMPFFYYAHTRLEYSVQEQLSDFLPNLFLASLLGVLGALLLAFIEWNAVIELLVMGSVYFLLYLVLSAIFGTRAFFILNDLVRSKVKK